VEILKPRVRASVAVLALACLAAGSGAASAADGPPGLTTPQVLPAFDPAAPACTLPPGLSHSLEFVQDNRRKFIEGVGDGLKRAAADRGLAYSDLSADNDAATQSSDVDLARTAGVGSLVAAPVDPAALAPALQRLMWSGGYVATIVPPPATTILNAPQYLTGKTLGEPAAQYIRDHFPGGANVVLLTQDSLQFLAPRIVAIRDALRSVPNVSIVADISPDPVNEAGGYATMKLVLLAQPRIDVVLGADTVVLGALRALREAGKTRPDQFIGGIDGEPEALAELAKGDGPYKLSVALGSPVFGYALGEFAADWLEGKSVPQAVDALPVPLTKDNLSSYEADQDNPAVVFADPARRNAYIRLYGNICYDSRDRYLNFPWSSETK
jgi:ribose transport system substrate-binding protein